MTGAAEWYTRLRDAYKSGSPIWVLHDEDVQKCTAYVAGATDCLKILLHPEGIADERPSSRDPSHDRPGEGLESLPYGPA